MFGEYIEIPVTCRSFYLQGPDWHYETSMPPWAMPDWEEET